MAQGPENDLRDIRYYTNTSEVDFVTDNRPLEDLNLNVLTVDNKAILAKTTANTAAATLGSHVGGSGVSEHPEATVAVAGFMSSSDNAKLVGIQAEAQINIISPLDALELVGGGVTRLHTHITASVANDGLMSAPDKVKLNGIQSGAQVNILTNPQVAGLTGGGDANAYHTHVTPTFSETFKEGPGSDGSPPGITYHSNVDHTGIDGVAPAFPDFVKVPYREDTPGITNTINNPAFNTIRVFSFNYSAFLSELAVVTAGISYMAVGGSWGSTMTFAVNDVSKSAPVVGGPDLIGTVTYQCLANNPLSFRPQPPDPDWSTVAGDGRMTMRCWQGGYGIGIGA